jgi:hypothetical protein
MDTLRKGTTQKNRECIYYDVRITDNDSTSVSRGKRDQVEEVKSNKTAQIKRTERKKEGGE